MQSMKRMEELIHLNKKINFEGKVGLLISKSQPIKNLGWTHPDLTLAVRPLSIMNSVCV